MKYKKLVTCAFLVSSIILCSCGKKTTKEPSLAGTDVDEAYVSADVVDNDKASGMAASIAVIGQNEPNSPDSDKIFSQAGLLVDATTGEVLFQKNVHQREYPASTTKILTSLLAIKYGDVNSSRTIGSEVVIDESNVIMCDFRWGDTIPFDIIIHGAMMMSGNDAAAALSQFAATSLDEFANKMNDEAKEIGAVESHFVNPHGLYNENHYTTAYDMYLIFNEAIKYDYFVKVISDLHYTNSFIRTTAYGTYEIACDYANTNRYVNGEKTAPSHIKVIGGKAGYTELAKRSYVMLAEANGHKYIFVIMRNESYDETYADLDYLLSLIPNNN